MGKSEVGVTKHDCGEHGWLTVKQIHQRMGIPASTIRDRVQRGVTGEELMRVRIGAREDRKETTYRDGAVRTGGVGTIALAVTVARAFPTRAPTVEELQSMFGMHRATAYRWREAFIDAIGVMKE